MSWKRLLKVLPGLAFLYWPAVSPQMPPQPAKLVVNSDPAGATTTINGVSRGVTNVTFNVSPGIYKVSVGGPGEKAYCSGTLSVTVNSGQTATWECVGTRWTKEGSI